MRALATIGEFAIPTCDRSVVDRKDTAGSGFACCLNAHAGKKAGKDNKLGLLKRGFFPGQPGELR
jgi:hypothetical protein